MCRIRRKFVCYVGVELITPLFIKSMGIRKFQTVEYNKLLLKRYVISVRVSAVLFWPFHAFLPEWKTRKERTRPHINRVERTKLPFQILILRHRRPSRPLSDALRRRYFYIFRSRRLVFEVPIFYYTYIYYAHKSEDGERRTRATKRRPRVCWSKKKNAFAIPSLVYDGVEKKKKENPTSERDRCGSSGESTEMKNRGRRRDSVQLRSTDTIGDLVSLSEGET